MKNLYIIGSLISAVMLSSCESNRDQREQMTGDPDNTEISMGNPFKLTLGDLKKEKMEIEKELEELKNSESELKAHDIQKFQPEISQIEIKLASLDVFLTEFTSASDAQKSKIYDQFKLKIKDIEEDIDEIEDRFNDQKVMEN